MLALQAMKLGLDCNAHHALLSGQLTAKDLRCSHGCLNASAPSVLTQLPQVVERVELIVMG